MKKILFTLVFAALSLCLVSCGKDKVYEQRHEFENYAWERLTDAKTITFSDINIEDTASVYDIYVDVRHTPYINEEVLKFIMQITTPDGITRISHHAIKLKDRFDKDWKGDAAGDLIDLSEKCRSFVNFPIKGAYKIDLINVGGKVKTIGIMDIGVKVVKSDLESYKNAE